MYLLIDLMYLFMDLTYLFMDLMYLLIDLMYLYIDLCSDSRDFPPTVPDSSTVATEPGMHA